MPVPGSLFVVCNLRSAPPSPYEGIMAFLDLETKTWNLDEANKLPGKEHNVVIILALVLEENTLLIFDLVVYQHWSQWRPLCHGRRKQLRAFDVGPQADLERRWHLSLVDSSRTVLFNTEMAFYEMSASIFYRSASLARTAVDHKAIYYVGQRQIRKWRKL